MVMRSRTPTAGMTSAQPSPLDSFRVGFMTSFTCKIKRLVPQVQWVVRRHPASAADEVAPRALADGVPRFLQEPLYLVRRRLQGRLGSPRAGRGAIDCYPDLLVDSPVVRQPRSANAEC